MGIPSMLGRRELGSRGESRGVHVDLTLVVQSSRLKCLGFLLRRSRIMRLSPVSKVSLFYRTTQATIPVIDSETDFVPPRSKKHQVWP